MFADQQVQIESLCLGWKNGSWKLPVKSERKEKESSVFFGELQSAAGYMRTLL